MPISPLVFVVVAASIKKCSYIVKTWLVRCWITPRKDIMEARARTESEGKIKAWFNQAGQFLREAKVDLKKVAWPSRKQTLGSTVVVLILVFAFAAFLGLADMVLAGIVRFVLQ